MNISRPYKNQKSRAQAMMEFALALPLLLLLLYGVLETGRYAFIRASTITAARQAVRYGSATGLAADGITPLYNDCAGIRAAAQKVGFINRFEDVDILITYDDGVIDGTSDSKPFSSPSPNPPIPTCDSGTFTDLNNGNRIIVTVSTEWQPIVPIVPFKALTLTSTSERTILSSVSIFVDGESPDFVDPNAGALQVVKTASSPTYSAIGTITYSYTLSNTSPGAADITSPAVTDDKVASVSCPAGPLVAGGSAITCTGTYQITQADLDAGSVTNLATASGTTNGATIQDTDSETITAIQSPELSLSISPSPAAASTAGTVITYTYTITNTGNVSLTDPYTITDDIASGFDCSVAEADSPLAPGNSTSCTGTYSVQPADITAGFFDNKATVTATYNDPVLGPTTTPASLSATATVITKPLVLTVTPTPSSASSVGQEITYNYTITNNSGGSLTLQGVTDNKAANNGSCNNVTIANGGSGSCTGTYTVTTADYNLGDPIQSSAYVTTTSGLTSNTVTKSVPLTQVKTLSIALVGTPTTSQPPGSMIAGTTTVTYTYSLTNTGNVALTSPFTVNNGVTTTCGSITSLAPATPAANCTVTYTVSQADIDAGSFVKTATASGMFGSTTVTSAGISTTVITYSGSRFSIAVFGLPNPITQVGNITYTYTITNTGSTDLASSYSITTSGTGSSAVSCALAAAALTPRNSTTCTSTKAVSVAGSYTVNVTAATASSGAVSATTPLPSATVTAFICTISNLTISEAVPFLSNFSKTATFDITNSVGMPLTITSIEFNWKSAGGRNLSSTLLGSTQISPSTADSDGFASYPVSGGDAGPWNLAGASNLILNFSKAGFEPITGLKIYFNEPGCGPLTYQ